MTEINKFHLINKVTLSPLAAGDKVLLIELIMRADDKWECHPCVERLCKAKGLKHEKNFQGVEKYLPGLVKVTKRGRAGNTYTLLVQGIMALGELEVTIKHTPPPQKDPAPADLTPAPADLYPAPADKDPAVEGANSTVNNTSNNTSDSTEETRVDSEPSLVTEESDAGLEQAHTDIIKEETEWEIEDEDELVKDDDGWTVPRWQLKR